jgi:hypothetical protein
VPYDLGATARLTAECRDPGGTLTTASTAVVTVTLPDATTATPTVTNTGIGLYRADYTTAQAGRHTVRWLFTSPAHAYTDSFDVWEAAPPAVLSLKDAKDLLKKTTPDDDARVRFWLNATTRAVEYFVGPVIVRQVVEDHHVGVVTALALHRTPAVSLVSVAALLSGGTSYDVDDLNLDGAKGIVTRKDGGQMVGPLRATYRAGRTVIAPNTTAAAQVILQHLWRTQTGEGRPQRGTSDYDVTEPIPGLGYAIPNRAVQLMNPDDQGPGMA